MSDNTDWKAMAQTMAADNARLCDRLITAEAVVEGLRKEIAGTLGKAADRLRALIAKHDAGRPS